MKIGKHNVSDKTLRKITEKHSRAAVGCVPQVISFLTCLKRNNFEDIACRAERRALEECARNAATSKKTTGPSLKYHLQRIASGRKKAPPLTPP